MPTKEQIEAIIKELQKILVISDWEINFDFCGDRKIQELTGEYNMAACERNMKRNCAFIYLNTDHKESDDWYDSIVHELYHIVTQPWHYQSRCLLDYVKDDTAHDRESNALNVHCESVIDRLTRGFVNAYPVSKFDHVLNDKGNS